MKKVLCFGDIFLRLSPDPAGEWLKQESLPVFLGGAELNVASALARWNIPVAYCTALPDNYMSRSIQSTLAEKGIDVSRIIHSGDRISIYYLAQGTDLKNAGVIYDRAHSATASLVPGTIDWDHIFDGISWFHFSAINPAINQNLAAVCKEALEAAQKKNITISVDLNYRSKLWKWGKQPIDVMPELVAYCDLVMGNIWAAELMLGTAISKDFVTHKEACIEQSARTSEEIIKRFERCTQVANTFRFDQGDHLDYYGTLYRNNDLHVSKQFNATNIVDKVGSGDCFMAGLIYGNLHQLPDQEIIDFAAAAAVEKMFIMGDATTAGTADIRRRLMESVN